MELSFELTFELDWFGMIPLNYKLSVDLWGKKQKRKKLIYEAKLVLVVLFLSFFARGLAKFKFGGIW